MHLVFFLPDTLCLSQYSSKSIGWKDSQESSGKQKIVSL